VFCQNQTCLDIATCTLIGQSLHNTLPVVGSQALVVAVLKCYGRFLFIKGLAWYFVVNPLGGLMFNHLATKGQQ